MDWIPAISTSALLTLILWLSRNLIINRLSKSVQHEFDEKLEVIRADLRAKEVEITTLRSSAISALANSQISLDKRKLEAVDQLWSAVTGLTPAKTLSLSMSVINLETVGSRVEKEPKLREFVQLIGGDFDVKKLDLGGAAKARPFVSPIAWGTYSAIHAVVMHAVAHWSMLKAGINTHGMIKKEVINNLVKAALPGRAEYIDQLEASGYYSLIDELELKLLTDFQDMLSGKDTDAASLKRASAIMKLSAELVDSTKTEKADNEGGISA
jgi:hypothetical protein